MYKDNRIICINRIYFGVPYIGEEADNTCDYLNRDFRKVLFGIIQRDILSNVIIATNDEKSPLFDLLQTFNNGLLVDTRKLLKPERKKNTKLDSSIELGSCTGGDFIKDLLELDESQLDEVIEIINQETNGLKDLYFENAQEKFKLLKKKVSTFNSKNYYGQLIKDNESLCLHKNRVPQKRELVDTIIENNYPITTKTKVYRSRNNLDIDGIARCLNEFAEIIRTYQSITCSMNVNFYVIQDLSLLQYIENYYKQFSIIDNHKKLIDRTYNETIKHLKVSLDVSHVSY